MEITIEFGSESRNSNPWFEPLQRHCRGMWRKANIPVSWRSDEQLAHVPDLPGQRITVNVKSKSIRLFDQIEDEPHRDQIEAGLRRYFRQPVVLEKEQLTRENNEETIRKTLAWMKRLVDAGNAKLVGASFPDWVQKLIDEERHGDVRTKDRRDAVEEETPPPAQA